MKHMLGAYSRVVIFASGLLMGIQVPSFVDQYQKRVDAHFQEVSNNISGFQSTADLLFDGDIQSLIAYYEQSQDRVFESDAGSIRNIFNRYTMLAAEHQVLTQNWYKSVFHVAFTPNPELFNEAFEQYSYTVPLNARALQWGAGLAVLCALFVELFVLIFIRGLGSLFRRRGLPHLR